jgi:superfamily I DNA/RNA helicase
MKYLAITKGTVSWLLERPNVVKAISDALRDPASLQGLTKSILVEGAFRLAASSDALLLGVWHEDYLSGTGDEPWGFVRYNVPYGLTSQPNIIHEVLERALAVVNQRLENLLIDQAWFFRNYPGLSAFTVSAGRGEEARRFTIGYVESEIASSAGYQHAVLVVGPEKIFQTAANVANSDLQVVPTLVAASNGLLNERRRRPLLDSPTLSELRAAVAPKVEPRKADYGDVNADLPVQEDLGYDSAWWSYEKWLRPDSPLTPMQRSLLESNVIIQFPVRLIGPAGSGKSLLMQLLAVKRLKLASEQGQVMRLLYIVHNAAMGRSVADRFAVLGASSNLQPDSDQQLVVTTLADYALTTLKLSDAAVISRDAEQTKQFQLGLVRDAVQKVFKEKADIVRDTLFASALTDAQALEIVTKLIMAEISTAIKGHGFVDDERRYVESELRLSRLHGVMKPEERRLAFAVFREYHYNTFEVLRVLDSDDLALSLLGTLRTPIWSLRRQESGFDHVFVDETQLFNDNERKILPFLTKGKAQHVPVVVALDQAQEIFGQTTAGLGALGISDIRDESLENSQRCASTILDLAFFVIERTVDLFDVNFPQFKRTQETLRADRSPLTEKPRIEQYQGDGSFARFIVKRVQELRAQNVRQIAVVCHADLYWESIRAEMTARLPYARILVERGERLIQDQPVAVLTKPEYVGGQEFDAVICVGLEDGLTPPRFVENENVQFAVDQQALREMYLAFTRARYKLIIGLSKGSRPTEVVREAIARDLVTGT